MENNVKGRVRLIYHNDVRDGKQIKVHKNVKFGNAVKIVNRRLSYRQNGFLALKAAYFIDNNVIGKKDESNFYTRIF